ncbi:hypothetical protein ElyMa_003395100 [Elysia marginata]|uniref:Uncharacterized protein n=1 Tax=Elysia marginata TaxID=1093978 RepID=A0AAV4JMY7_9GAST|nr:hypothetical protein ElyMa_003395100 [Elysia marginata]
MTPGLAAALYGKEKSVFDLCNNWLSQLKKASRNKRVPSVTGDSQPPDALIRPKQTDSGLIEHLNNKVFCDTSQPTNAVLRPKEAPADLTEHLDSQTSCSVLVPKIDKISEATLDPTLSSCVPEPVSSKNIQVTVTHTSRLATNTNSHQRQQMANEPNRTAAKLFNSKIAEWEKRQAMIKEVLCSIQRDSLSRKKRVESIQHLSESDLKNLAEVRFQTEHLFHQMEMERMMQKPDNRTKMWVFSTPVLAQVGEQACRSFVKRYRNICNDLKWSVRFYTKLYHDLGKDTITLFNKKQKTGCLKIKIPRMTFLNKSGKFSQIMAAQTSKDVVMPVSEGIDAAFWGTEEPLLPAEQPINNSQCQMIKFDESTLKQSHESAQQLCLEFENLCQNWKSLALEIEMLIHKIRAVLSCSDKLSSTDIEACCEALGCASSLLQALCTQFVCLSLSQSKKDAIKWTNLKEIRKVIGKKASQTVSSRFKNLYNLLVQIRAQCYQVFLKNGDAIMQYNQNVDDALQVWLPMLIDDMQEQIQALFSEGSIPERPLQEINLYSLDPIVQTLRQNLAIASLKCDKAYQDTCGLHLNEEFFTPSANDGSNQIQMDTKLCD